MLPYCSLSLPTLLHLHFRSSNSPCDDSILHNFALKRVRGFPRGRFERLVHNHLIPCSSGATCMKWSDTRQLRFRGPIGANLFLINYHNFPLWIPLKKAYKARHSNTLGIQHSAHKHTQSTYLRGVVVWNHVEHDVAVFQHLAEQMCALFGVVHTRNQNVLDHPRHLQLCRVGVQIYIYTWKRQIIFKAHKCQIVLLMMTYKHTKSTLRISPLPLRKIHFLPWTGCCFSSCNSPNAGRGLPAAAATDELSRWAQ